MRGSLAKQLRRLAQQAMPGSAIRHDDHIVRHVPANFRRKDRSTSAIVRVDPQSARAFYQKSKQVIKDPIQAAAAGLKGLAMHRELARTYNQEVVRDVHEGEQIDKTISESLNARYPGVEVAAGPIDESESVPSEQPLTNDDVDALFGQKPLRGDSHSHTAIDDAPSGGSERGVMSSVAIVDESPFIKDDKADRDTTDSM